MIELKKNRRTILGAALVASIVGLGIGQVVLQNKANAQREAQGYMLAATEGEQLIRNGGSILIKVAPSTGSDNLALGTQQVPIRAGIPVHQHAQMDEVFYVLEGFFREVASPPGASPKSLTREQRDEIARKYGTQFK